MNISEVWQPRLILTLIGIIAIVPLIVYLEVVPLEGTKLDLWTGSKVNWDFFSYFKACWLCVFAGLGMLIFFDSRKRKETVFNRYLAGYAVLAGLSTLFSEHTKVALFGSFDRCEGFPVILAYIATAFLFLNFAEDEKNLKIVVGSLMVSALIASLIGAFQFFGTDFFKTCLGKFLILPAKFRGISSEIQFQGGEGCVYCTFPNPNYTGSYFSMIMVFASGLFLLSKGSRRFGLIPLLATFFLNWLGCLSRAGLLGGISGLTGLLILSRRDWRRNALALASLCAIFFSLAFIMDFHTLRTRGSKRIITALSPDLVTNAPLVKSDFEDLILRKDSVEVRFGSGIIKAEFREKEFRFFNERGQVIPFKTRKQLLIFPTGEFRGFTIKAMPEKKILQIARESVVLNFLLTDEGFRVLDSLGRPKQIKPIERFGFEGNDRWGNGRGFIWARSIPLLKGTILTGFGPDTFLLHFPQDDFLGKIQAGYPLGWAIDKPHNLYLQIAINTGILSLILLLVLWGTYLLDSFRLFWNLELTGFHEKTGAAISMAILAYLVTGMFNDSAVSVAPVFWALLGTGIGINLKLQRGKQFK